MKEIIYTHWKNRAIEDEPGEIWKFIEGTNNRYSVSSLGRVKSHRTIQDIGPSSLIKRECPLILKQYKDRNDYLRVCIQYPTRTKFTLVHVLVGRLFQPNPQNKKEIHHIKNVRTYNPAINLEWNTRTENNRATILNIGKSYHVIDIEKADNSIYEASPRKKGVSYIYAITDHNGIVVYVGKSNSPIQRFRQHKTCARHPLLCKQFKLQWLKSILDKGEPSLLILKESPLAEWQKWEKHFIAYYRNAGFNLYNVTAGGNEMYEPNKKALALKNEISKKEINQYDLSGQYIKTWTSIRLAARELQIHHQVIIRVLKDNRSSAGGFMWKYKTNECANENIDPKKDLGRPIFTTLENGDKKIWGSIKAASSELGLRSSSISNAIIRNNRLYGQRYYYLPQ